MSTLFNEDKVKLKHILEIYKDLPGYPAYDDILYFVVKRAAGKGKDEVTFTDYLLKNKIVESEEHETNLNKSIENLIEKKQIELVRETDNKRFFKVIQNPYYTD